MKRKPTHVATMSPIDMIKEELQSKYGLENFVIQISGHDVEPTLAERIVLDYGENVICNDFDDSKWHSWKSDDGQFRVTMFHKEF